jgi:hypothetical protein
MREETRTGCPRQMEMTNLTGRVGFHKECTAPVIDEIAVVHPQMKTVAEKLLI